MPLVVSALVVSALVSAVVALVVVSDFVATDRGTTCRIAILVGRCSGLSFCHCSTGLQGDRLEQAKNDEERHIRGIGNSACHWGNNVHRCTLWLWSLRLFLVVPFAT